MIEKDRIIDVTNRDNGTVGYTIPDLGNLHRSFQPNETKHISFDELQKLSWITGGKKLIKDYLTINDKEVVNELLGNVEPEYFYTKEDVEKVLKEGSLEQLQDTIQFGPDGVKDLIKDVAVEMPLNDVAKREEIKNSLNFDVTKAIEINKETKDLEQSSAARPIRRVQSVAATSSEEPTGRRTIPMKIIK